MKNHPAVLCLLLCSLLSGCIDLRVNVVINPDWSGTFVFRVEMLEQMYQLLLDQMEKADNAPFDLDEEALRARVEAKGGRLQRFHSQTDNGIRRLEMDVFLPDARVMLDDAAEDRVSLTRRGGTWFLWFAGKEMDQQEAEQAMALMGPTLAGVRGRVTIEVPRIVDTNLESEDGKRAHYVLNYDEDVGAKTGQAAVEAFTGMMAARWISFDGME